MSWWAVNVSVLSILGLAFEFEAMLVGNVWLFIASAGLVATAVCSKQVEAEHGLPKVETSEPEEPIRASNRSDFNVNWKNPSGKRFITSPQKISFAFNIPAQESSRDVPKRSLLKKSFSRVLFNQKINVKIIKAATETKFMQGMIFGTLNPKEYGGYMVQDTAYLFHAVKALELGAKQIERQNPLFAHFYMSQAEKYNTYYKAMLKTWRLEDVGNVALGPAAKTYILYQSVLSQEDPRYLSIALLPCTMLWPEMARELIKSVEKTSPYGDWFEENIRELEYQGSLEKFVDKHFNSIEEDKAGRIFCEGMLNELNFFREACGESLYSLDEVCQM